MPRFFLPAIQIRETRAVLSGAEFHHLRHVLRLGRGDGVTLCDEHGREYLGVIARLSATTAEITITDSFITPGGSLSLTLAQGMLKGQKMDLVIEKATELGASRIVPFFSSFTVAQLPPERQRERLARWQRIAQSAAKQSESPVPEVTEPYSFPEFLASVPDGTGKLLMYEKERTLTLRAFAQSHPSFSSLCVMVGPEGGFSAEEVERARAAGFHILGLGPQVLRAETAGIATVVLCRFLWGEAELPPLPPRSRMP
jgi:16S rRNA (uracil1498-N3)-methyltransferase